jgi:hypothetical protein
MHAQKRKEAFHEPQNGFVDFQRLAQLRVHGTDARPILEVEALHERKCSARFPTCDRVNVRAEHARSNLLLPDRAPRREEVRLPAQQLQGR